ncbi:MAG: PAS domain-containing protein [Saprospirales bacterium]|nr:PAS domain-containing protein [Saprospirales bacterium]
MASEKTAIHTDQAEWLELILHSSPFGIITLDEKGVVGLCNDQALIHMGLEPHKEVLRNKPLVKWLTHIAPLQERIEEVYRKGSFFFDLTELPIAEGFFNFRGRPMADGMLLTTNDLTLMKRVEAAALNAMLEGQESERRRLAKDIHDGIGPLLSTLRLNIENVHNRIPAGDPKLEKSVENVTELLHTIAQEIRNVSHALMPSVLLDFGLVSALETLCQMADESGQVHVHFFHSGLSKRLDQNTELSLYRTAQELLNNALKYAKAQTINLQLIQHPGSILLMVEDDGIGFDREAMKRSHSEGIGLRNVQTRVKFLGGTFSLDTRPERGVVATIDIPYKP